IAIAAAAISAFCLIALHIVSPEFEVSWRMVSEYANGKYGWLLTAVFLTWAVASCALAVALRPLRATWLGRFGLVFLMLAGVGQAMGGVFDLNHPLHGLAFAIGVPSLTLAAILVTLALRRSGVDIAMWPAHLSWISFVLMAATMALFFMSLNRAGIDVSAQSGPLAELPEGVAAYNGWANRLLFAASYLWLILAGRVASRGTVLKPCWRVGRVALLSLGSGDPKKFPQSSIPRALDRPSWLGSFSTEEAVAQEATMLQKFPMYAYIPAQDVTRARGFYEGKLGFTPKAEVDGGVAYEFADHTACFLYPTPNAGTSRASQAFWQVDDIERVVADLKARGVQFEHYDMPGAATTGDIVTAGGAKAAWFKDTEGNIMAVIQSL
ncbi:MAG TPA: DUF998 domain-containing protein, partial [Burkholderiaceae bacterium]|nr:DUF998 domain-containing protein [Burkholderiaceae bacterium]